MARGCKRAHKHVPDSTSRFLRRAQEKQCALKHRGGALGGARGALVQLCRRPLTDGSAEETTFTKLVRPPRPPRAPPECMRCRGPHAALANAKRGTPACAVAVENPCGMCGGDDHLTQYCESTKVPHGPPVA